jgi:hypothetical protein
VEERERFITMFNKATIRHELEETLKQLSFQAGVVHGLAEVEGKDPQLITDARSNTPMLLPILIAKAQVLNGLAALATDKS